MHMQLINGTGGKSIYTFTCLLVSQQQIEFNYEYWNQKQQTIKFVAYKSLKKIQE